MLLETNTRIRFDGFVLDRPAWQLRWQDDTIVLNRKTFDLLLFLIDHRDRVVPKEELMQALWPDQFVEESNLSQHVFLLRKALSTYDAGKKIIETVPGRGYRFTSRVEAEPRAGSGQGASAPIVLSASSSVTEITIEREEIVPHSPTEAAAESSTRKISRLRWTAAGVFAVLVLGVAGWFGWQHWLDRTGGDPVDVVIAPVAGSTGDAVLDQALVAALRMDLSQSPFVSVVSDARVRATLTEMKQNPDAAMDAGTAREVCERTNSQAVLHGSVAQLGQHFLLTEEATSCLNGTVLAATKQEAVKAEALPGAIDKIAGTMRQKLGESRRSIARFDTPLVPAKTASLEALKYYSQAMALGAQGKASDAIGLEQKAIEADPGFAAAYFDLATFYGATEQFEALQEALKKAYNLRDTATEPVRQVISGLYTYMVTQDLYASERNYRNWTELYPRSPQAWNGLYLVQRELGHHADAVESARRALALRPAIQGLYANLAFEQSQTGDIKGSIATCEKAIARNLDGDLIRSNYFTDVYTLRDAALVQKQRDWEAAHPDAVYIRIAEANIAIVEGRFADAHRLIAENDATFRRLGLAVTADRVLTDLSNNLIEAGDVAAGKQLFQTVKPDPKEEYTVVGLAWMGEASAAEAALHAMQAQFPQGTIWNDYRAPEVHALLAMNAHKPKEAIAALERARPLEGRDPFLPMLRGNAYLEAGEPALAESEYRSVLGRPWLAPEMDELPLSWLGLARALAAQGKRPAAVEAYENFLNLWSKADPHATFLVAAKNELTALENPASRAQ